VQFVQRLARLLEVSEDPGGMLVEELTRTGQVKAAPDLLE